MAPTDSTSTDQPSANTNGGDPLHGPRPRTNSDERHVHDAHTANCTADTAAQVDVRAMPLLVERADADADKRDRRRQQVRKDRRRSRPCAGRRNRRRPGRAPSPVHCRALTRSPIQTQASSDGENGLQADQHRARARGHAAVERHEHTAEDKARARGVATSATLPYSRSVRGHWRARGERDRAHQHRDEREAIGRGTRTAARTGKPYLAAMKPVLHSRTNSPGKNAAPSVRWEELPQPPVALYTSDRRISMKRSGRASGANPTPRIQRVLVARGEQQAAQAGERRMRQCRPHEPRGEALPAIRRQHEHVGQIRERGAIGHEAREPDLRAVTVEAEVERSGQCALDGRAREFLATSSSRQEAVDDVEVEPGVVRVEISNSPRRATNGRSAVTDAQSLAAPDAGVDLAATITAWRGGATSCSAQCLR